MLRMAHLKDGTSEFWTMRRTISFLSSLSFLSLWFSKTGQWYGVFVFDSAPFATPPPGAASVVAVELVGVVRARWRRGRGVGEWCLGGRSWNSMLAERSTRQPHM